MSFGGGSNYTQSTSYQTNIPEYARPYVETMMRGTQEQLFTGNKTEDGGFNITGFKEFRPFGATYDESGKQIGYDPGKGIAGFQPMQETAFRNIAGLQTPGEYGLAGLGAVSGMQGFNRGFAQDYMSPFIEEAMAPQLREAARTSGMQGMQQQAEAVGRGAFGGSREALMRSERERNLGMQLNDIRARGYQTAYEQAANQFNQDMMRRLQGAGQLASIGSQRLGAEKDIIGLQERAGTQQQALEQRKLDQALQDYATSQQYPLMQLGFMSNMLRGLPMQSVNTQQYGAAPSPITQLIGAAGTGAMLSNAYGSPTGRKEGGQIKEYDVGGEVREDLEDMDNAALQRYIKESQSETAKRIAQRILRERSPGMAGGGIVAFAAGEDVKEDKTQEETDREKLRDVFRRVKAAGTDIITAPARGLAGAFESTFTRGARAAGIPVPYLPSDFYGGDPTSLTPFYDRLRREDFEKQRDRVQPSQAQQDAAAGFTRPGPTVAAANAQSGAAPSGTAAAPTDTAAAPTGAAAAPSGTAAGTTAAAAGLPASTLKLEDLLASRSPEVAEALAGMKKTREEIEQEANKTPEQRVAEMRKLYGDLATSQANKDYRAKMMEERANLKDETRRNRDLIMAQMFADMATRPGPVLVAMAGSVRDRIPDLIANDKEAKKAQRDIDKIIRDLDEATRLEEVGMIDKAVAQKEKALSRLDSFSQHYSKFVGDVGLAGEREAGAARRTLADITAGRERTALQVGAQDRATEATERARQQSVLEAGVRAAQSNLTNAETRLTASLDKNEAFKRAQQMAGMTIDSNTSPEMRKMIEDARATVAKMTESLEEKLKPYRTAVRNAELRAAGKNPSEVDPLGLR